MENRFEVLNEETFDAAINWRTYYGATANALLGLALAASVAIPQVVAESSDIRDIDIRRPDQVTSPHATQP